MQGLLVTRRPHRGWLFLRTPQRPRAGTGPCRWVSRGSQTLGVVLSQQPAENERVLSFGVISFPRSIVRPHPNPAGPGGTGMGWWAERGWGRPSLLCQWDKPPADCSFRVFIFFKHPKLFYLLIFFFLTLTLTSGKLKGNPHPALLWEFLGRAALGGQG